RAGISIELLGADKTEIEPGGILSPVLLVFVLSTPLFASVFVFAPEMERKMEKTIGMRIRECRVKLGMTQEELAEALLTKKSTISAYENDKIDIKVSILKQIAKILDTSVFYLVGEQDEDIDSEVMKMAMILQQIQSKELRKIAIEQVKVFTFLQ
ncbi:helix-turn-helix domain-containing protein, partial [Floccifex sp.]|uniref:helix-turn-helix domain-containing protein n=1 Tax=Floccifex sp. TaxID=2815810 RepID=UPI003F0C3CF3